MTRYEDILRFWFEEIEPEQWFHKDDDFDALIAERFSAIHAQAIQCELYSWRGQPRGRLAEIIILDQFPRNMFRNTPQAFVADPMALTLAQEAVASETDHQLAIEEKKFLYMPYMHSESVKIHEAAEELFSQEGLESSLEWELKHKNIIDRFGRYPHRNKILGRQSTPEELAFLEQPGSSF
ncbi:MAG: DUF924 family protein [Desulfocapsaceae bacterium]|nr:DUF924 family protein [Desulfocapsaceae bacterium]